MGVPTMMASWKDEGVTVDPRWQDCGFERDFFIEKSQWLARDTGSPGAIEMYFHIAGRLMLHCARDYWLAAPMFFHAIAGLEAMLRVHFSASEKQNFSELLQLAVADGTFLEAKFVSSLEWPDHFTELVDPNTPCVDQFVKLLTALRNDYFHGRFHFHPVMLTITLQIREAADMLKMPRTPRPSVTLMW